ncbi:MAG: DMT family transporter [Bryobacterales bacterium]|nr:DMT family transporter [Bryobacteraceae bacterium]MDW8131922.1 DMT family transporter [Bryobacterales bacterium]
MRSALADGLLLLTAALLFSTGGAAIKATQLTGWQVACFRSGAGALALLAMSREARRGWCKHLIPVGLAYATTLVLFVLANKLTTAANAIFLQDAAPLYLVVLGPWLLGEPARRSELVLLGVVAVGIGLFFAAREAPLETAPDPFRGNVLALVSGFTWALTIAGLRWLGSRRPGSAATAPVVGNALAFAACLPLALPVNALEWKDAAVILYLGVFQIALAYLCMTRALQRVRALEASLLLLVEPALNPVWAWLAHGERPAPLALAGGALILGACLAHAVRRAGRT